MQKFLRTYAKTGSVTRAAKVAKISLAAHYRQRETDAAYRKAFEFPGCQLLFEPRRFLQRFELLEQIRRFVLLFPIRPKDLNLRPLGYEFYGSFLLVPRNSLLSVR